MTIKHKQSYIFVRFKCKLTMSYVSAAAAAAAAAWSSIRRKQSSCSSSSLSTYEDLEDTETQSHG